MADKKSKDNPFDMFHEDMEKASKSINSAVGKPFTSYHRDGEDTKAARARGNQSDPGYDLSVKGNTLSSKLKSPAERIGNEVEASQVKPSNRYASGGRVRGVGAAQRGFGRGKIT